MTRVVLVTQQFAESGTPEALCTLALARAYADRGHTVHVLTGRAPAPRPALEIDRTLSIQRLSTRPGSPHALAAQAARAIISLRRAGRCDVVECVGMPSATLTMHALRTILGHRIPCIHISIDPQPDWIAPLADRHIDLARIEPGEPGFPCDPANWSPPEGHPKAFIACDAITTAQQTPIVEAYKAARVSDAGWALALPGHDGRWAILSAQNPADHPSQPPTQPPGREPPEPQHITIASRPISPIAPLHALQRGHAAIASHHSPLARASEELGRDLIFTQQSGDLARAMIAAATLDPAERTRRANLAFGQFGPSCTPSRVADFHETIWASVLAAPKPAPALAAWQHLERTEADASPQWMATG